MMSAKETGRNAPCPCGSGKKFKQCCQREVLAQTENARALAGEVAGTLQTAMEHHRSGQLSEAEILYRRILQVQPDHPDALHLLGLIARASGRHEVAIDWVSKAIQAKPSEPVFHNSLGNEYLSLGRLGDAENHYRQATHLKPDYAEAHYNLGVALHLQGKVDEAIISYQRALKATPGYAEAAYNLGVAYQSQEKLNEAVASYKKAIEGKPGYVQAILNLGVVSQMLGKLDAAIGAFRQALDIAPGYAEAYSNLGNALREQGRLAEAAMSCRKALELNPGLVEAHNNMGTVMREQGNLAGALQCFNQALQLKPDFAEAYCNLAGVYKEQSRPEEVMRYSQQALAIRENYPDAYNSLAWAFQTQGRLDEAFACYQKSYSIKPNNAVLITSALMLPPIMGTREEVLASRRNFERNLDQLIDDDVRLDDPFKEGCETNFYLAFQGMNDKEIQQKIARFYEQACPSLLYTAQHCHHPKPAGSRVRIGFLSKFIYRHSVALCFGRVVEDLSRHPEFEVALLSTHDHQTETIKNMYANFSGAHVQLPNSLEQAREKVAELELDILCYLDIGMEPLSYFMAFSRLARSQCVLSGHPVTTGIGNLDYHLSSALTEPEDADDHYSEKLVRLPIGLFYYERPEMPAAFKTRKQLGLPEEGRIYLCPMLLQKIHPDFDAAIAHILQLDEQGYVVLFGDATRTMWQGLLEKRLENSIPEGVRGRILFLPWIQDYSDFISVNKAADVVLDPFHFGIGTTAIATFSVGTPIVTMPGEFLRGRVGLGYCKLLDVTECVADDAGSYAQKAAAIARDIGLREKIRSKILANNHVLFENQKPIHDVTDFFLGLGDVGRIAGGQTEMIE